MPPQIPKLRPETLAAQGMGRVADPYHDIVPPLYLSTTYERGADGAFPGGRVYSRADNPTYDQAGIVGRSHRQTFHLVDSRKGFQHHPLVIPARQGPVLVP